MSIKTDVYGYIPKDEKKCVKMLGVYNACQTAGIDSPVEVVDFFAGIDDPNNSPGISIDLQKHVCCEEYNEDMQNGFTIDIHKLPLDVKIIRFINSY